MMSSSFALLTSLALLAPGEAAQATPPPIRVLSVTGIDSQADDELYFGLDGDRPIDVLATARSKKTGRDEPVAFVFSHGRGRVFSLVLGHDAKAIDMPGTAELLRRGCAWCAGR